METYILIILASMIGLINYSNKPTKYELKMKDGTQTKVMVQKNSSYACPLYCEAEHIHHAIIIDDDIISLGNQSIYHISESKENLPALFCSSQIILSMTSMKPKTVKDDLPDVVNASKEK